MHDNGTVVFFRAISRAPSGRSRRGIPVHVGRQHSDDDDDVDSKPSATATASVTAAAATATPERDMREVSTRHQFALPDHGYGANASRVMPVYVPAFAGTHCAYTY